MRSMSGGGRNGKRLSLNFPVQAPGSPHPARHTPSSSTSATPVTPFLPRLAEKGFHSPTDSGSFLVDLAAQERRVLELKEELQRAERELEKLKRQWAMHEASRKRDELRHAEQMQPLGSSLNSVENSGDESSGSARRSTERRMRSATNAAASNSRRKVMSGQKHTRALSLLSPARNGAPEPFPQPRPLTEPDGPDPAASRSVPSPNILASNVPPETPRHASARGPGGANGDPPKDAILRTGRRMAEDFKDGLWTFIDDLRQATVGDEPVNGMGHRATGPNTASNAARKKSGKEGPEGAAKPSPSRSATGKRSSRSSLRVESPLGAALIDVGGTFWQEQGISEARDRTGDVAPPPSTDSPHPDVAQTRVRGEDDRWDAWEPSDAKEQSPRWSSSTAVSEGRLSPPTGQSSPSTSTSTVAMPSQKTTAAKREDLAWPALKQLSPVNLKRTASTLLSDWERSLTPRPEAASARGPARTQSPGLGKESKGD
ncbi:MAG: hypothetical protein M1832_002876 [Thelocarpon impressellum]|nr:MAG: hypothetical protein M1832_002876 [Thelocarpon impressellum]